MYAIWSFMFYFLLFLGALGGWFLSLFQIFRTSDLCRLQGSVDLLLEIATGENTRGNLPTTAKHPR